LKYRKQKTLSECLPVAIFNAVKYYNPDNKITNDNFYNIIKRLCKTNKTGTDCDRAYQCILFCDFVSLLRLIGQYINPTFQLVKKHVGKGFSAIAIIEGRQGPHAVFIESFDKKKKRFRVVNLIKSHYPISLTEEKAKRIIISYCWILSEPRRLK
jgi:hypothetical protein